MKKKEAKGVWKALSLGLSLLLAVSAAGTDAVFTWQNTITRYMGTTTGSVTGADGDNNFVSDYSSIEDLLAAKRDLCIQIGEEGCVLLKNENDALPINKTDMSIPEAEKWMHRPVQLLLIQEQKSPISWRA